MSPVKTILIVEDNHDLQTLLTTLLQQSGYAVKSLFDGPIQSLIRKNPLPDVILLDMNLPHATGVEIGQQLKSDPVTEDIPVIMMSANTDIKELCEKAGAADYIPKPFLMKDLLAKIIKYAKCEF